MKHGRRGGDISGLQSRYGGVAVKLWVELWVQILRDASSNLLMWAWVDLNHQHHPYRAGAVWSYNLQERGDCQNSQAVQDVAFCGLSCALTTSAFEGS